MHFLCDCVYYNSGLNQTVNIGINYSILNYVFDIRKTESIPCMHVNGEFNWVAMAILFLRGGKANNKTLSPAIA